MKKALIIFLFLSSMAKLTLFPLNKTESLFSSQNKKENQPTRRGKIKKIALYGSSALAGAALTSFAIQRYRTSPASDPRSPVLPPRPDSLPLNRDPRGPSSGSLPRGSGKKALSATHPGKSSITRPHVFEVSPGDLTTLLDHPETTQLSQIPSDQWTQLSPMVTRYLKAYPHAYKALSSLTIDDLNILACSYESEQEALRGGREVRRSFGSIVSNLSSYFNPRELQLLVVLQEQNPQLATSFNTQSIQKVKRTLHDILLEIYKKSPTNYYELQRPII